MHKEKNTKTKADDLIKLSVSYLRKNGFFKGLVGGDIPVIQDMSIVAFFDSLLAEGAVIPETIPVVGSTVREAGSPVAENSMGRVPCVGILYRNGCPGRHP